MMTDRTSPKKKAKELAKYFRAERPDYPYLKSVFRALREELEIQVPRVPVRLPEVPTEEEMPLFYQAVWNCRNFTEMFFLCKGGVWELPKWTDFPQHGQGYTWYYGYY